MVLFKRNKKKKEIPMGECSWCGKKQSLNKFKKKIEIRSIITNKLVSWGVICNTCVRDEFQSKEKKP